MDITSSTQDGIVNLHFVLPAGATQETCSPGLICAYQACEDSGLAPTWVSTDECLKLKPGKQDVFVIEPFEGEAFEYLNLTIGFKCVRVLGPRCLLTCLHRKEPIPELPSPIHNTAMKGLVITTTGFDKQEKAELQSKVERMAGIYSNNFHEGVTHLVVKSVGSKKYIVAMEKEMPVMTGEWIHAVWEAVNKDFREDVIGTDEQFLSYNCPPLYGLTICLSQISRKDKEVIRKLISNNGGAYSPSLEMDKTHVLILPAAEGEKYNYAKNWRIHCLSPEWIYDSIEKGYAMDMEKYKVQKQFGASSPKKDIDEEALLPPDISMCSTIMMSETQMPIRIDETMNSTLAPGGLSFISSKRSPIAVNNDKVAKALEAVDQLELQAAKKAGLFLDGCKIFLSGFDDSQMEKLRRILNNGGATRFNQLTEAVSHVVIGKIENDHITTMSKWVDKPHVVYGDWIAECVTAKTQVDEGPYSYFSSSLNQEETASPFTKPKQKSEVSTPAQEKVDETFVDEALMQQYMKGSVSRRMSSAANDSLNASALPASQADALHQGIFTGKTITISGYTQEQEEELASLLIEEGGEILPLDHPGRVDFSCASLTGEGQVHPKVKESFSHLYVEECHEFKALISMEYFYLPLVFRHEPPPLQSCVIAISTYKNKERSFLVSVAQLLGAEFQEMFAKKDNPKKGVRCSTHLICSEPEGDKYKAAVKWGVPAVTRDFLLQCAAMGQHISEDDFRVDNEERIVLDPLVVMKDLLGIESGAQSPGGYSATHFEDTNNDVTISDCGNTSLIAPTPVNKKVRALRDQAAADLPSPSNIKTPDLETMRRMYPTPGTKANDSLDEMPTPDTPYGSTWHGPNPPARIRKGFKRMLDALPQDKPPAKKPNTPTRDLYNKFFEGVQKSLQAKEAKYGNSKTVNKQSPRVDVKTVEETVREEMETTETNDITSADQHGILTGVVVFCNQKLRDQQQELYQTVASMGGDYRWVYEPAVTHYIYTGRGNDINKEFRMARDQGKFVVAPEWVWMCRDEETKIEESLFPHTHNPKMALSIISQKSGTPVGPRRGRPRKSEKLSVDETAEASQMSETSTRTGHSSESDADTAEVEEAKKAAALSKQLEELEALANKTSGSGRKNAALRKPSLSERAKNTPPRSGGTPRSAHHTPSNAAMQANTEVAESQNTAITWEDPQEREARQRINAELTRDTQEILDEQMQHQQKAEATDNDKENKPDNDVKVPHSKQSLSKVFESNNHTTKRNHVFVLSGLNDQEDRDRYVEIIEGLGGTICQEQSWDPSVTHLVTVKPNRSEKILSAIASGRWVLNLSYLEASMEAGKFVKEDEHEWGNPSAVDLPEFPQDSIEEKLVAAAYRWRTALTTDGECRGAFQNMKAIIHSSKERVQSLARLVNSGHGEVVSVKPPYTEGEDITHFFVEPHKNPSKYDLAHFVSQKIPCLPPVYLSNYLIMDPIPDAYENCIDEYKKIERDMRGMLDSEPLTDD